MGRVYNKEAEASDPYYKGAWRWEVEAKKEAAHPLAISLPHDETRQEAIVGWVKNWFSVRGVDCPAGGGGADLYFCLPSRRRAEDARRLKWLREQVAPCVRRLVVALGEEEVYNALGVRPVV